MANKKITELTELSATPADGDLFAVVDINDTTDSVNGTTKKITASNVAPLATSSVYGKTKLSTAPASATAPIAVGDNDTRLPSQGENDALVGTSGTPSTSNPYATKATTDTLATTTSVNTATFPTVKVSTAFETAGRFILTTATATNTFNTLGLVQDYAGGTSRYAKARLEGAYMKSFLGSPKISAGFLITNIGNEAGNQVYFGTGDVECPTSTAGHTFTNRHIGFKLIKTSTSDLSLYATQADNTTENASTAILTGLVANDFIEVLAKANGTTSVDYYARKNGGAWSTVTNLTSNFPTNSDAAGESLLQCSIHSKNTYSITLITWKYASYER